MSRGKDKFDRLQREREEALERLVAAEHKLLDLGFQKRTLDQFWQRHQQMPSYSQEVKRAFDAYFKARADSSS